MIVGNEVQVLNEHDQFADVEMIDTSQATTVVQLAERPPQGELKITAQMIVKVFEYCRHVEQIRL
jgi:hypothetical protein